MSSTLTNETIKEVNNMDKDTYDQYVFELLQQTQKDYHGTLGVTPLTDPPLLFPLSPGSKQDYEDMDTS